LRRATTVCFVVQLVCGWLFERTLPKRPPPREVYSLAPLMRVP
jgi:hypothetical protein